MKKTLITLSAVTLALSSVLSGCANMDDTQRRTGTGAALGLVAESAGDQLNSQYGELPEATKMLEEAVAKAVAGILTNGYGSDREYEADRTAYELAKVCGFEPNGLRLALQKDEANTAKAKETFNTHPRTGDRLKKLPGGEKKKGKG